MSCWGLCRMAGSQFCPVLIGEPSLDSLEQTASLPRRDVGDYAGSLDGGDWSGRSSGK